MIGLSSNASKFSLVGLALLMAAILGYLFGRYGADQTLVQIVVVIIAIPFAFTLSIEWLVWISLISDILVDTHLISEGAIFYLRYAPMGLLTLHGILTLVGDRAKSKYLPGFLLYPACLLGMMALVSSLYAINPSVTFQKALSFVFAIIGFGTTLPLVINGLAAQKRSTNRLLAICMFFLLLSLAGYVTGRPDYFLDYVDFQ